MFIAFLLVPGGRIPLFIVYCSLVILCTDLSTLYGLLGTKAHVHGAFQSDMFFSSIMLNVVNQI